MRLCGCEKLQKPARKQGLYTQVGGYALANESVSKLLESPGGTYGNSPAIHRWVGSDSDASPVGTTEYPMIMCVLPSLPGLCIRYSYFPPMNRWAIFNRPCGTNPEFRHSL